MLQKDKQILEFYNSLSCSQKQEYMKIHDMVLLNEATDSDGYVLMTFELSDEMEEKLKTLMLPNESMGECVSRILTEFVKNIDKNSVETRLDNLEKEMKYIKHQVFDDLK
jgi:hypothetical protein